MATDEDGDRLEYVADLLLQLYGIAVAERCETLSGLLALAQGEAARVASQRAALAQAAALLQRPRD